MIIILSTLLLMLGNYPCQGDYTQEFWDYKVKKVQGIERRVTEIDFDVKSNITYIRGETSHVYILDPKNEKILNSFNSKFAKALVTNKIVYIILTDKRNMRHYIHRINPESMELDELSLHYNYPDDEKYRDAYCIDSDGYIYINIAGLYDLKDPPRLTALKPYNRYFLSLDKIDKNFAFNACEEDKNGNLYFMNTDLKWGGLVLMSRENKNHLKGKHVPEVNSRILDFKTWNDNQLYVEDDDGLISVKLLKTGELLPASHRTKYYFFDRKFNERFYIIEDHNNGAESYLHYITKENLTPVKIPKPMVPSIVKYNKRPVYVEDKHGNAYFVYRKTHRYDKLLILKTTDMEWKIQSMIKIFDLAVDNDIIWILRAKLWVLNPEDLSRHNIRIYDKDWQPDTESFLNVKKTNEVYIATKNAVFIVSKKNQTISRYSKNITEN